MMTTYKLTRNGTTLAYGITKRIGLVLLERIKEGAVDQANTNFGGNGDSYFMTVGVNNYVMEKEQ